MPSITKVIGAGKRTPNSQLSCTGTADFASAIIQITDTSVVDGRYIIIVGLGGVTGVNPPSTPQVNLVPFNQVYQLETDQGGSEVIVNVRRT